MNIKSVKLQHEKNLLSIPGVTGVGLDRPNQKIIVYIENEKTFNFGLIPLGIEGYEIEFRISQKKYYLQSSCDNEDRPLIGGVCIGCEWSCPPYTCVGCGTLGAIVKDINTNEEYLLTNRHVVEGDNHEIISNIMNPCKIGGEVIGLVNTLSVYEDDLFDVALISPSVSTQRTIKSIGEVQGASYSEVGMSVKKYGRKTGLTYGTIIDIDYSLVIEGIYYTNQILINMNSGLGDSGSVVLDQNNKAVGLLFAGDGEEVIANQMSNIIKVFKIYFNNPNELPSQPPCNCTDWENKECVSNTQRRQTRTCNPSECDSEERIIDDNSCSIEPPEEKPNPLIPLALMSIPLLLIPLMKKK